MPKLDFFCHNPSNPVDVLVLKLDVIITAAVFLLVHTPGYTLVETHVVGQFSISLE